MLLHRRSLLGALAALGGGACGTAWAASNSFEVKRLSVKGKHASRFDLLVPKHLAKEEKVRLLVALHGLGESHDPELGAAAWVDRYGLGTSYERLRAPPIVKTGKRGDWTDDRLSEVNAALKKRPFSGLAVACPFTPNFKDVADRGKAIREYGEWIVGEVVPLARKEAPCSTSASATALDGCSMGGPFALDIFIQHPDAFGAVGTVQGAFGEQRAPKYAEQLADVVDKHGAKSIHLLSSEGDKFKGSAKALGSELTKRKVPNTVRIIPGPHDQPWLREAGTIEMLLFHERRP
ncbi:MAG: hypothetical protein HOW73_13970 [Polyangiaceae bacterium]|nr:hypothetical protein [Polyangiaceae bacterium]